MNPYHLVIDCHAERTRFYPSDEHAAKVCRRWARIVNRHIKLNSWSIASRIREDHGGSLPWAVYRDREVNGALQMFVAPCPCVAKG